MDTSSGRDGRDDFESFFRSVFARAVAVAQRVTGDRASAEDAAVEALAKAHFRWKRIGGQPWRDAWVYKVAVNEAIRRLPRPAPAQPFPAADDPANHVALRQALTAALRQLPRRQPGRRRRHRRRRRPLPGHQGRAHVTNPGALESVTRADRTAAGTT